MKVNEEKRQNGDENLDMEIIQDDWGEEWNEELRKTIVTHTSKVSYSPELSLKNIASLYYGKLGILGKNAKMFELMIKDLGYTYKANKSKIIELEKQMRRSSDNYKTYLKKIGKKMTVSYKDDDGNVRVFDVKPSKLKKDIKEAKKQIGVAEKEVKQMVDELKVLVDVLQMWLLLEARKKMSDEIELGDKVKDKITGYVGIAVARTEFLNGCVQYSVAGKVGKDNKMQDEIGIDSQSLEVMKSRKKKVEKSDSGGAMRKGVKLRGY